MSAVYGRGSSLRVGWLNAVGGPVISILRRFSASVWGAFGLGGLGAGLKFYEV